MTADLVESTSELEVEKQEQQHSYYLSFTFPQVPQALYVSSKEYTDYDKKCENSNFLNGVKWSPDGSCLLSVSDDNWFRVYDMPQTVVQDEPLCSGFQEDLPLRDNFAPGARLQNGETVYDYCWYAAMTVADPVSCCFLSTSRGHPIHLWDVCGGGSLRCSYRGFNAADEVTHAFSVASSADGRRLAGGYDRAVLLFDVARPGRDCTRLETFRKKREGNLPGIVSCLAFSRCGSLLAAGTYAAALALLDPRAREPVALLEGHRGGLTQVQFSPDGGYLFSGARQDPDVICWDVRQLSGALYRLPRASAGSNQRIQFDVEPVGRHLISGGTDGAARVFDLRTGERVDELRLRPLDTCLNGVAFHPSWDLLATASGERRYSLHAHRKRRRESKTLKAQEDERSRQANSLIIWRLKYSLDDPYGGAGDG